MKRHTHTKAYTSDTHKACQAATFAETFFLSLALQEVWRKPPPEETPSTRALPQSYLHGFSSHTYHLSPHVRALSSIATLMLGGKPSTRTLPRSHLQRSLLGGKPSTLTLSQSHQTYHPSPLVRASSGIATCSVKSPLRASRFLLE